MYLVPDSYLPDRQYRYTEEGAYTKKLEQLENQINNILNDSNLSTSKKLTLINQLQSSFQKYIKIFRNLTEGDEMGGDSSSISSLFQNQPQLSYSQSEFQTKSSPQPLKPEVLSPPLKTHHPIGEVIQKTIEKLSKTPSKSSPAEQSSELIQFDDESSKSSEASAPIKEEEKKSHIPVRLKSTISPNRLSAIATRTRAKGETPKKPQRGKGFSKCEIRSLIKLAKEI